MAQRLAKEKERKKKKEGWGGGGKKKGREKVTTDDSVVACGQRRVHKVMPHLPTVAATKLGGSKVSLRLLRTC